MIYLDAAPELLVVEDGPRREAVLHLGSGVERNEDILLSGSTKTSQDSSKQTLSVPMVPRHCWVVLRQSVDEGR